MKRANRMCQAIVAMLMIIGLGGCAAGASSGKTAIVTITQGNVAHKFTAEVAITPQEQAQGLMYRTSMAPDAAMLFPFENAKYANFWMKNTEIPLDIIFIRADGTIDRIAQNTVPESEEQIVSGGLISAVLEVNGGTTARLKIDDKAIIKWKFESGQHTKN